MTWLINLLTKNTVSFAILLSIFAVSMILSELHGRRHVQEKWDAYVIEQNEIMTRASLERQIENERIRSQQVKISDDIQRKHEKDVSDMRLRIDSERLRIGKSLCRTSGEANSKGAGIGDEDSPGVRVLPEKVDRDIRELIEETEIVSSIARTCQAFVVKNGLF